MKVTHFSLGRRQRGDTVEITLTNSANVRLMNDINFSRYKRKSDNYKFLGGEVRNRIFHLTIPNSGYWYVVIDRGETGGEVRSSVNVFPRILPQKKQTSSSATPIYDVFIAHASEDKEFLVRPLKCALTFRGLSVWYDESSLHIGDNLRQSIDKGLSASRAGLVVLSPSFISKGWTQYELDGIVTRMVSGSQFILPIWHKITKKKIMDFSPSLANIVGRDADIYTIGEIANEIEKRLKDIGK